MSCWSRGPVADPQGARRASEGSAAELHGAGERRHRRGAAAAAERQDRPRAAGGGRCRAAGKREARVAPRNAGRGKAARRAEGRARLRRRRRRGQFLRSRRHLAARHALSRARQRRSQCRTRPRRPDAGRNRRFAGRMHRREDQLRRPQSAALADGAPAWRQQFLLAAAAAGARRKRPCAGRCRGDRLSARRDRLLAAVQGPVRGAQGRRAAVLDRRRQPVDGLHRARGRAERRARVLRRSRQGAQPASTRPSPMPGGSARKPFRSPG